MKGSVLLSHGLESGPTATKVSALARVAQARGWQAECLDYRDLDATRDVNRLADRVARLRMRATGTNGLVLAGSSMGAFVSGLVSLVVRPRALFLMAPPLAIPGFATRFDAARVPTTIVHGWRDELIPADDVSGFAKARGDELHLVDDEHRLAAHVDYCAARFDDLLARLA
jgi:predicted alpha/beta-hydrolase family hydrolase